MRAFTFHCFTRGDLTLFQVFLWCFGLFVLFVCWSFAVCGCVVLSLTILRSGSCLPEHGREEKKKTGCLCTYVVQDKRVFVQH